MRLAIADPPYLGRADRWYGQGRGHRGGAGRAGTHEGARDWDNPVTHQGLVGWLEAGYDGWVIAAAVDSLAIYLPVCPPGVRVLVWRKGNAIPSGSRVAHQWEPVLARIPDARRGRAEGVAVTDVLEPGVGVRSGYVGAKPHRWTHWVLDVLGYQDGDTVHDVFVGSGAVSMARLLHQPSPAQQCACCGAPIQQPVRGRPRRTCSVACRQRLVRRHR